MRRRTWVTSILAAGLVVLTAGSASGLEPRVQKIQSSGSDIPIEDCGAFVVLLTYTTDETITTYTDAAGQAIRVSIRFRLSATLTNSVTRKTASESGSSLVIADLQTGQARTVGLVLQIRVAGVGVVVIELGRVTLLPSGTPVVGGAVSDLQSGSLFCSILA